ncbi:MAG TPA: M1 family metallopeptidase [Acidimicrobiales bacterium]|nr:M1 family metallopeptidase [Acidimicrobiales bacterium]
MSGTESTSAGDHRLPRTVVPERYHLELEPDLDAASFRGHVEIDVVVAEPTPTVVCNAAELAIGRVTATLADGSDLVATVEVDADAERLTASFAEPLPAGPARLTIDFDGVLNDRLHGFYRSTSTADDGTTRTVATTQFEPTDARRAFPCWDEPDLKATFGVTLVVPDGLTALSNAAEVERTAAPGGRTRVRFAETMVMSTYLVAFVVGEFDATPAVDVRGVPLRIVAPPGRLHLASFAAEAAEFSLTFLADWFGLPYPADKLDHIAIPDFAAGAMENLGLVTYRESSLLLDRDEASRLELERVATVVAHETAHMWFGDLVTMKWWNGIWLNEAFATFMELTTNHAWHPEWDVWTAFGAGKAAAMALDAQRSTRPVEFAVGDPADAEAMFDLLTYQKGGAVLRMLELHIGPEVFRAGIGRYLARHAHANTETSDLWDALEAASGAPVRSIMESWIFQGGHPVVDVALDGTTLTLTQRRFTFDGRDDGERWVVPVGLRASVDGKVVSEQLLLDGASSAVDLGGPVDWVVVNEGGAGFYRVHYSSELLDRLLTADLAHLAPLERMGLLNDTWANVLAGTADLADWARLVAALGAEEVDPDVWGAALGPLRLLEVAAAPADRPAVAAFARRVAGPAMGRLGWQAADGESHRTAITRSRLISALGTVGADAEVRAEAARRFAGGDADLAPDLRTAVANVVAASGGAAGWRELRRRYLETTNPQERDRNLYALASAGDRDLLVETLDFSSSEEVRNQNGGFVVGLVLANPSAGEPAWTWVERHWPLLVERYRAALLSRLLEGISGLLEPGLPDRVRAFLEAADVPLAPQRVAQLVERLDVNDRFARTWRDRLVEALA